MFLFYPTNHKFFLCGFVMGTWLILRHLKISFEYRFRQPSLDFLYEAQNGEKTLREYQNLID